MKELLLGFIILISSQLSHQQYDTYRVNKGASTSRRDQDLGRCENCELEFCATRTVNLMLAEAPGDDDLTEMMSNRFD